MPEKKCGKNGSLHRNSLAKCKPIGKQTAKCFIIKSSQNERQIQDPKSQIPNRKMPSGKTHDAVTFLLTAPVFAATWQVAGSLPTAFLVMFAFLFGGLMFGPDLDTRSSQTSRWSVFSSLWYPYQAFFKHRSRWSHGLIFGTFLRVVYFVGVLTLLAFLFVFLYSVYSGGDIPNLWEFSKSWQVIGRYVRTNFGADAFPAVFIGLWLGAASHTLTDMAGSFIKHGRIMEFL